MKEKKSQTRPCNEKVLSAVLALVLSLIVTSTFASGSAGKKPNETDKQQIIVQVAQNWLDVGIKQYQRGFFSAARQSFLRAREYEQYLTPQQKSQINQYLENIRSALPEKEILLNRIALADKLIEQGKFIKAKAHLTKIKDNSLLSALQRKQIAGKIEKLDQQLISRKERAARLYKQSVELYNAGQLEKARDGFIELAHSGFAAAPAKKLPEDYLAKIDKVLGLAVPPPATTQMQSSDSNTVETPAQPPQNQLPDVPIHATIRQSYAGALVKDAVAKVRQLVNEGRYYKAKQAVKTAQETINENRGLIGGELAEKHNAALKQLSEKIEKGRTKWLGKFNRTENAMP